jgi:hypothetical protein
MKIQYCKNCKQVTIHKKYIHLGTLILVLITGGLYLPCILCYQCRCWICGNPYWNN